MKGAAQQADLEYLKDMAEEGAKMPLLGQPIAFWWGSLSFVMMLIHWATLKGYMPWTIKMIGLGWMAYAAIGITGTIVLQRRIRNHPGACSLGNRMTESVWNMVMFGIFAYVGGCALAVVFADKPVWLFDTILPVAFVLYALAYGATARFLRNKVAGIAALVSLGFAVVTLAFVGAPMMYLLTAFGILLTTGIPLLGRGSAA